MKSMWSFLDKKPKKSGYNMLWLDLETTGLDADNCHILEVGMILTDSDLNELESVAFPICVSDSVLEGMDDWCKKTHAESGLVDACKRSIYPLSIVEESCLYYIEAWRLDRPVLAGSSIHFDKGFIKKHMPKLNEKLHYRLMDVSSLMEIFYHMYGYETQFTRAPEHRALGDIRHSIAVLKHLKQFFKEDTLYEMASKQPKGGV